MLTPPVRILSNRHMMSLIDWPAFLEASHTAFRHFSAGLSNSPNRLRLMLRDGRRFAVMPGADPESGALGAKLIGYYPDNPRHGFARVTGAYMLFDPVTGLPLALMEGALLTNLRTAAGAVVAARVLAPQGWRRLGIIGSGGLASMSAQAFLATDTPAQICLYSRTVANLGRFAADLHAWSGAKITACRTPEEVVQGADVIVCGTDTQVPVFDGTALQGGGLVISLGANTPGTRELDLATMLAGRIFVDSRTAVLAECGEVIIPQKQGKLPADPLSAELGEVLNGARLGRLEASEALVFLSTGLAVQDALTAQVIYARAVQQGIGTVAPLFE